MVGEGERSRDLPLVGVHPTATDRSMPVLELARESEARGLRSLSLPEHTHIPVEGNTAFDRYKRTLDPYISLAFVAATTNLFVGTAISLVAQHDAIALAKAIATLDHLAPGRFSLGVGFGYNQAEIADHGVPVKQRSIVVEETIALLRALWTQEEASFEGRFVQLRPSWSWPKPAIDQVPPVLLGVKASERNFERIVTWGDGWIPMGNGIATRPELATDLELLRSQWGDAGRTAPLEVCCFFNPGTLAEMQRDIEKAAELQIQRAEVYLEDRPSDEILPILDDLAVAYQRAGAV